MVRRAIVLALFAPLLAGSAVGAQSLPARTVLALYFSSEDYPANIIHDDGIRDAFRSSKWPISALTEYLESDRFPAEQASLRLRDYLREKYRGQPIDVVIAITDTALQFALRFRDELFAGIPIVFSGNTNPEETVRQDLPIEHAPLVPTFDSRVLRRWGISESRQPPGNTIRYRQTGAWDVYKSAIVIAGLLLLLQTVLIGALLVQRTRWRRTENALVESQQRYSLASAAGSVGIWDWNFDTNELFIDARLKSLLGFSDAEISSRPDDWGARVHPDDVPIAIAAINACIHGDSDSYEIAHRMLHKDGSVKWMMSRGSALRAADGRLRRLVGTKVDITQRKLAEDEIRESQAVLDMSNRQIQDLAGRLIASQEEERARLARDLHDDLSQEIAGLSIALSSLKRRIAAVPDDGGVAGAVSSLQERTAALAANIRRLSHDLHPSVLQHAGLVAALRAHCAELERQESLTVTFASNGDFESTSTEAALCLYRVAQESLRNVVTHAHARNVEVFLQRVGDHAELTISDNGDGFAVTAVRERSHGLGLISITERVRLVGGTVSIVTELRQGTRVRVQIPANGHVLESPSA